MCGAPHVHAVGLSLGALETGGDDGLPHIQATAQATHTITRPVSSQLPSPSALFAALICLQHVSCIR